MDIFILFLVLVGPSGQPTITTQEFIGRASCESAQVIFMEKTDDAFKTGYHTSWIYGKSAWCVPR